MKTPVGLSQSALIDRYVGSDFDHVIHVSENLDVLNELSDKLDVIPEISAELDKFYEDIKEFNGTWLGIVSDLPEGNHIAGSICIYNGANLHHGLYIWMPVNFTTFTEVTTDPRNGIELVEGTWEHSSIQGPQGIEGPQGVQGPIGPQGVQGNTGTAPRHEWATDTIGSLRFQNPDNTWGDFYNIRGPQGIQGVQGAQGAAGTAPMHRWVGTSLQFTNPDYQWDTDLVNLVGPQGPQGIQGIQGVQGNIGLSPAHEWHPNNDGRVRFQQADGSWGEYFNLTGPQGIQGIQGIQGVQGTSGKDGTSFKFDEIGPQSELSNWADQPKNFAFYALDYPNADGSFGAIFIKESNTVGDWTIPIAFGTGPKGPQGEQGVQGIQGPQGEKGVQGDKGDKGPTGDMGLQGIQGPKGDKGDTGDTGPQGPQGAVGPTGLKGVQGDQGETGPKGDKGDQGAIGPTGAVGPQGEQGPEGVRGPTGTQGPQGVEGPQGPAGPQGPIGLQGPTGATGATGPTGPQGAKGETGDKGPDGVAGRSAELFLCNTTAVSFLSSYVYPRSGVTETFKYRLCNFRVSVATAYTRYLIFDFNQALRVTTGLETNNMSSASTTMDFTTSITSNLSLSGHTSTTQEVKYTTSGYSTDIVSTDLNPLLGLAVLPVNYTGDIWIDITLAVKFKDVTSISSGMRFIIYPKFLTSSVGGKGYIPITVGSSGGSLTQL